MGVRRCAVIGGGIVGAACARRLLAVEPDAHVVLLEKETALATHQTGRNSGVVHAGLYYTPGSLKARLCRRGVGLLQEFCAEHGVAYTECGKVLVALDATEQARLADIEARARANGVPDIRRLDADGVREVEPHVRGVAGLHSPRTAIVDFPDVTRALADEVRARGGGIHLGVEVTDLVEGRGEVTVQGIRQDGTQEGTQYSEAFDLVLVCAGLQSDRVAALAGDVRDPQIVPFRGEYHLLRPERRSLVRGLVYPVPDPSLPFLGVHLTPRVDGEVMIGPNAVMALAREGYDWRTVSFWDLRDIVRSPGFRRFARQNWRIGLQEMAGSLSRRRFVGAARRYLPDLKPGDVVAGPSGIRAQALDPDGTMVDDFRVNRRGHVVAVRNAPSPAATSSLAIAEHIVDIALDRSTPDRATPAQRPGAARDEGA